MWYQRVVNDVIRITRVRNDTSKLSDRVVVELQRQILSGELPFGGRVPTEVELCEMFEVSRTVIRDALRTLTAIGLIEVQHGRGIRVTHPNDKSAGAALAILLLRSNLTVGEVLEARGLVETEICAQAARYATTEDVSRLEQRLGAFRSAVEQGNVEQAFEEHLSFHAALYDSIHVPALALMLRPMIEVILLSSLPPVLDEPRMWEVEAHEHILDAVRSRDEQRLRAALQEHFLEMESASYREYRSQTLADSEAVRHLIARINDHPVHHGRDNLVH